MTFEVKIDAEQLNRALADAIIQSDLGPMIQASVNEFVGNFANNWDLRRQIDKVVRKLIIAECEKVLKEKQPLIEEFVRQHLTAEHLDRAFKKLTDAYVHSDRW